MAEQTPLARAKREIERLRQKVAETDRWIFQLSAERQAAEQAVEQAQQRQQAAERDGRAMVRARELADRTVRILREDGSALTGKIAEQAKEILEISHILGEREDNLRSVEQELSRLAVDYHDAIQRLVQRHKADLDLEKRKLDWLKSVVKVLLVKPKLGSWPLPSLFNTRHVRDRILKSRGLFTRKVYLAANDDVAKAGADPLLHAVLHGLDEGRINV